MLLRHCFVFFKVCLWEGLCCKVVLSAVSEAAIEIILNVWFGANLAMETKLLPLSGLRGKRNALGRVHDVWTVKTLNVLVVEEASCEMFVLEASRLTCGGNPTCTWRLPVSFFECKMRASHNSAKQECPTKAPCKNARQECQNKSMLEESLARVSGRSVMKGCAILRLGSWAESSFFSDDHFPCHAR